MQLYYITAALVLASATSALTTAPIHSLGGVCGGTTTPPQPVCDVAQRLTCWYDPRNADRMGASGRCVPVVGEGQTCGGSIRPTDLPPQCDSGLTCDVHMMIVGAPGKCIKVKAAEGEACGGGTALAIECQSGLSCESDDSAFGFGFKYGKCVSKQDSGSQDDSQTPVASTPPQDPELGEKCGNGTRYAYQCAADYTCFHPRPMPGSSGECVHAAHVHESCGGSVEYPSQCVDPGTYCKPSGHGIGGNGTCEYRPVDEEDQ